MPDNDNDALPVPLHGGADKRAQALYNAIRDVVAERGQGMPFPTVLGVLWLVLADLRAEQRP